MAQLYSGGIVTATGFKIDSPQLIDDRCAVELDSDLDNIPNLCKGLHAYSDENGGSLHYYNGTNWIRVATGGDLSEIDLQTVTNLSELELYDGEVNALLVKDSIRGGLFIKKETGTVDDTFIYESATTGVWERQVTTDLPINVLWNPNVDNTGIEGNVAELLKVYNSATERGFTKVYHPEGIYYLDSTMVAPPNLHYYGAGKGKTVLTFNGNGADYGLQILGSYEQIGEIASIVTNQDDSIQIDTNVNLNPQDLIVVSDTIQGSYGISYYREGEFFKVKDIVVLSNVINLETGVLAGGYPVGSIVYKIAKNWVRISDMTLVGNRTVPDEPTIDAFNILLELTLLQDIEVYNTEMSNVNATMFSLHNVFGGSIHNNDINLTYYLEGGTGTEISKTRHGLISYGSVNLDIFQNNIYANRHAIDMADNVRGFQTTQTSVPVLSRNINIHDNYLSSSIETAANMHIGEYVTFKDNIIYGGLSLAGNHLQTIGNQISVRSENNSVSVIELRDIKGTDILIQDNHLYGKNSTVVAQRATAIYARLNWSSDALLQETDGKIRILNNTIIQEDSESAIYLVNLIVRPGLQPDLEFSENKIQNNSDFTNLIGFQGWNVSSTWGSFGDLQIKGNQLNNVELNAIRTNDITVKDNSIKGVNYNALSVTNFDELRAFGNRVNSNLEVGTTAEEESSFYIQDGNLVILDDNEFDSPNNLNQLNVGSVTTLVRGKYHQISGNAGASLTSVTNDLAWEYFFKNITADKFIVRGSTSSSFLVGDGTTRTIAPTDFGINTSGRMLVSTGSGTGWTNLSYASTAGSNTLAQRTFTGGRLKMGSPTESDDGVTLGYANSNFQPLDGDLTSIAGLSGTSGLLRKTAANTWSLDTNTYATSGDLLEIDLETVLSNGYQAVLNPIQVGNIRINGNNISSQNTNGNITFLPNGTGRLQYDAPNGSGSETNALFKNSNNELVIRTLNTGAFADISNYLTTTSASSLFELKANKGQAGGYVPLNNTGKISSEFLDITGSSYIGTWNADTNTPTISNAVGSAGDYYRVTVAGTQDLGSGNITFTIGDDVRHNGSIWERVPSGQSVVSVNDYTGVVNLEADDIDYSNTSSGLDATNVQDAIDEVRDLDLDDFKNETINKFVRLDQTLIKLEENMTFSVGTGKMFETIEEAIDIALSYYPNADYKITILIDGGYEINNRIVYQGLDFSHIRISTTDWIISNVTSSQAFSFSRSWLPEFFEFKLMFNDSLSNNLTTGIHCLSSSNLIVSHSEISGFDTGIWVEESTSIRIQNTQVTVDGGSTNAKRGIRFQNSQARLVGVSIEAVGDGGNVGLQVLNGSTVDYSKTQSATVEPHITGNFVNSVYITNASVLSVTHQNTTFSSSAENIFIDGGTAVSSLTNKTFTSNIPKNVLTNEGMFIDSYTVVPTYLTANQTITLSSDLSGSGTTSISATITNDAVTNTKLADMAQGTIKGRVASGIGDPQDLTLDAVIKAMGLSIPVIYDLEGFTLPAMSAPPAQNSFSPITILTGTSIPANMIDWEITWTASGIHYKLSSIGDYNVELRESGGDIQISGQTRSQSAIVVDDTINEPKIIFYVKPE